MLSDEEAESVQAMLRVERKGFASRRSADYLAVRKQLEEQARAMFIDKGGKPRLQRPHYMTLGACEWLLEWYAHGTCLKLPLGCFNASAVSFTYGDLFPTMRYLDGKPYREKVYTRDEIIQVIEQFGLPQVWNADGSLGPERYIEVQVWDDTPLRPYIKYVDR
ncbi:hypothetical protein [Marinicrinis lubricantis]|uniref:Uncharacterized protein n=1 Tax=Marinicrinis lubricantis TaxID=2086470 RepID=A0ABW1IRF4_9BACL